MRHALKNESSVPFYTRGTNPTITLLQEKIAALEGAEACLAFASGSAAVAAAIMANVQAGDHVICVQKPYSWTFKLLTLLLPRYGVETTFVDGTDIHNFEKARTEKTKLVYLESPNSGTFELQDLEKTGKWAKEKGLVSVIDNSYCSPYFQKPISLGIDITVHSATKYLAGHSDAVAGVVCGTKAMMEKVFASEFMTLGGIISPFNAWLLIRGLRTLEIRLERSNNTGMELVDWLANHPKIEKIYYPFHPSFPQYELAQKQMKGCGGMFTVVLKAESITQVEKFCNALKYFLMAVSWGGYESLIYPFCTQIDSSNYSRPGIDFRMIRFYVGLESLNNLKKDIENAFLEMEQ